jgi:tetratricopeptide (TPR) repeat protein
MAFRRVLPKQPCPRMRTALKTLFFAALVPVLAQKAAPDSAYEKALAYYEQENYDACITAIRPAIKDAEGKPDLRILVAHCHAGKKNYADAIAHLRIVAEENESRTDVREDILSLLIAQGKYREARRAGYRYAEAIKDNGKAVPPSLTLHVAQAELGYGKPSAALSLAREAKQSENSDIKYGGIIAETRALIALGNLAEADIALSYAEAMRDSELHNMLRANISEVQWAQQKFPEDKRADVVAGYEKLSRSENIEIKTAAGKNLERVKAVKAP